MNLIRDPWIPVRRRDGGEQRISPLQLVDPALDPVEITASRADFTSALYQLLIGLLQVSFAPADLQAWSGLYRGAPSTADLEAAFAPWEDAFELDPESGPAFFQDLDPLLHADPIEIAKLLIDTPGEKTVSDNNDLFLHAGGVRQLCPACAAAALLTLQINAPSGGAGHRVSLRGGGPLTTLRLPRSPDATLFQKLWSNVVPPSSLAAESPRHRADIMPWLAPTRTSDPKGIGDTTPLEAHALGAYFSMPRRIRLDWKTCRPGTCDLCGETAEHCVRQYRTRPYGVNYTGAWLHPLTPYLLDPKQENLPLSLKGQRGGIGYRHWLGLAVGDKDGPARTATVVRYFNSQPRKSLPEQARDARLWCCGYDMDNMKARCWYDATLPLPTVEPDDLQDLTLAVRQVLECAGEMAALVSKQAGAATHPGGAADPSIRQTFSHASESAFYRFLESAMQSIAEPARTGKAAEDWLAAARRSALEVFDAHVLSTPVQEGNMERTVVARAGLERSFRAGKSKQLAHWIKNQKEAAA